MAAWDVADVGACRALLPDDLAAVCLNRDPLGIAASAADGGVRLVGRAGSMSCRAVSDGKASGCDGGPVPLWAVEPVGVSGEPGLLTLRGNPGLLPGDDGDVAVAWRRVREARLADHAGTVVVELPSTPAAFERATRGATDERTGGVTLSRGDTSGVVVNPSLRGASPDARAHLLAHELAHAADGTATWRGGRWLAEGWAEHVAAPLSPAVVAASDAAARARLAAAGVPAALPPDAAFELGDDAEADYALARLAVVELVDRLGEERARDTVRAWAAGSPGVVDQAPLTAWWRERLARGV